MEFELEFDHRWNWTWMLPVMLLLMAGLGTLGRALTPVGDKLLTWSEWQVLQMRQAYRQELTVLRKDVEILAGLLEDAPDPVRAQLAAEQVLAHTQQGQEMLTTQREAVALAAVALRDWAIGAVERQIAEVALDQAIYMLEEAGLN
jgi:hypothetical protein